MCCCSRDSHFLKSADVTVETVSPRALATSCSTRRQKSSAVSVSPFLCTAGSILNEAPSILLNTAHNLHHECTYLIWKTVIGENSVQNRSHHPLLPATVCGAHISKDTRGACNIKVPPTSSSHVPIADSSSHLTLYPSPSHLHPLSLLLLPSPPSPLSQQLIPYFHLATSTFTHTTSASHSHLHHIWNTFTHTTSASHSHLHHIWNTFTHTTSASHSHLHHIWNTFTHTPTHTYQTGSKESRC